MSDHLRGFPSFSGLGIGPEIQARWRFRMARVGMDPSGESVHGLYHRESYSGGVYRLEVGTVARAKYTDWGLRLRIPLRIGSTYMPDQYRSRRKRFYTPYLGQDLAYARMRIILALRQALDQMVLAVISSVPKK